MRLARRRRSTRHRFATHGSMPSAGDRGFAAPLGFLEAGVEAAGAHELALGLRVGGGMAHDPSMA